MGIPGWDLSVDLVTDSKASIDIMDQCNSPIGLKDVLRPEMDVALEICVNLGGLNVNVKVIKVRSHIDANKVPDQRHREVNDMTDKLATERRD